MYGLGATFLRQSFDVLARQTCTDFDIVISDHSKTDEIEKVCDAYKNVLDVKYFKNTENRGNSAANTNNAIKKADGALIKILFQDDFLYDETSLEKIAKSFDAEKDRWLVTACESTKDGVTFFRPFYPHYEDKTILFKNTVSSPSVLTIKNEDPALFDEKLIWWMDSDYYKRCFERFGAPKILNDINVVNRMGSHQVTNTLATENRREKEYAYILEKYDIKNARGLILRYRAKRYMRALKKKIL